ncbi:sensor domain-containing diguanylate cyclase [Pseudoalteromonas fenneropenaei]|uniref:Sensor domain-containing diguanylate cyclase n=1 Tax=Pseudoalteromonas fenneropenaei TaxID=1737459 RepID=A0ABV7CIX0_9GAMM
MQIPQKPLQEDLRLATLKGLGLLDSKPEERFDRVTRIAKRLFDVPIVLVSLIDDERQWFKSCVGLDVQETSRDISFCGHAILGDEVFVVNNALEDARFADNPLVLQAPSIRFYAGCPIQAENGQKLGTLCLIDSRPRFLPEEDILLLKDLAAIIEHEIIAYHLATQDELTHLSNRRGFLSLGQYALELCQRQNFPASIVFFDLDGLKAVNDQFGHEMGDNVLRFFAAHLKNCTRRSDLLARLGGDEFVMLLINEDQQYATALVEQFALSLNAAENSAHLPCKVKFSSGIVHFDGSNHCELTELIAAADKKMYVSKKAKKRLS